MKKTSKQYIEEAQGQLFAEQAVSDSDLQKMLFDLVKFVQDHPDMKDSEVKKLVNGIQKMWLEKEMAKQQKK